MKGAFRIEEYTNRGAGRLPFVLTFPEGLEVSRDRISGIEKKQKKTVNDLWVLARYYHIESKKRNQLEKARGLYVSISSKDKRYRFMAITNMACLLSDMGMYQETERILQNLIDEESPNIPTYYNLYLLYKYSGHLKDGIKVLSIMKERFPDDIVAFIELGDIFMSRGKYDIAERAYREAMDADTGSCIPVYKLAKLKEETRKYSESERYYEICIRRFPGFREAYIDYSRLLVKQDKGEKAGKILKMAVERFGGEKLRKGIK